MTGGGRGCGVPHSDGVEWLCRSGCNFMWGYSSSASLRKTSSGDHWLTRDEHFSFFRLLMIVVPRNLTDSSIASSSYNYYYQPLLLIIPLQLLLLIMIIDNTDSIINKQLSVLSSSQFGGSGLPLPPAGCRPVASAGPRLIQVDHGRLGKAVASTLQTAAVRHFPV